MSTGANKRGMKPRRVAIRRDRTRAEIIAIARRFLAKASLADFTLDEVADALGVTKPAIYHYFPNRDALMRAAVAEGQLEHGRVLLKAARAADDGPAVLGALTTAFIEHYRDRLEYFRLDFAWSQIHGDSQTTRDLILPLFNELTQVVSEKLQRGTDVTPLRARQLAVVAWTSAIGLMSALSVAASGGTDFVHPTNTLLAIINGALEASVRDL
jgi:AcrR family transcriptional regulator